MQNNATNHIRKEIQQMFQKLIVKYTRNQVLINQVIDEEKQFVKVCELLRDINSGQRQQDFTQRTANDFKYRQRVMFGSVGQDIAFKLDNQDQVFQQLMYEDSQLFQRQSILTFELSIFQLHLFLNYLSQLFIKHHGSETQILQQAELSLIQSSKLNDQTRLLLFALAKYLIRSMLDKIIVVKSLVSSINEKIMHSFQQKQLFVKEKWIHLVHKFIETIFLYNLVMISLSYTGQVNLNHYSQKPKNHWITKIQEKVYFLQEILQKPMILVKLFVEQLKKSQQIKSIFPFISTKLSQLSVRFFLENFFPQNQPLSDIRGSRSLEAFDKQPAIICKYMTHFTQYCMQIVSELSDPKNFSLQQIHNVSRYILILLIINFQQLTLIHLQNQVKQKYGQLFYHRFEIQKIKNDRLSKAVQRAKRHRKLAIQNYKKYQERMENEEQVQKSQNLKKLKEMKENQKQIIFFVEQIVCNCKVYANKAKDQIQKDNKSPSKYKKAELDNLITKNYRYIIEMSSKSYMNDKVIQKSFRRLSVKRLRCQLCYRQFLQGQLVFVNTNNQSIDFNNSNDKSKNKSFQSLEQLQSVSRESLHYFVKQVSILFLQYSKLFSMISTLPFYSYLTEQYNEWVKTQKIKFSSLPEPETLKQLMKILDFFYIYKGKKIDAELFQSKQKDELLQMLGKYNNWTGMIVTLVRKIKNIVEPTDKIKFDMKNDQFDFNESMNVRSINKERKTSISKIKQIEALLKRPELNREKENSSQKPLPQKIEQSKMHKQTQIKTQPRQIMNESRRFKKIKQSNLIKVESMEEEKSLGDFSQISSSKTSMSKQNSKISKIKSRDYDGVCPQDYLAIQKISSQMTDNCGLFPLEQLHYPFFTIFDLSTTIQMVSLIDQNLTGFQRTISCLQMVQIKAKHQTIQLLQKQRCIPPRMFNPLHILSLQRFSLIYSKSNDFDDDKNSRQDCIIQRKWQLLLLKSKINQNFKDHTVPQIQKHGTQIDSEDDEEQGYIYLERID